MVAYIVWPLCNVFLDLLIDFHSKLREIIIVTNSATSSATYALSWCSVCLWTSPYGITIEDRLIFESYSWHGYRGEGFASVSYTTN